MDLKLPDRQPRIAGETGPFRARLERRPAGEGIEELVLSLSAEGMHIPGPLTVEWFEPLVDGLAVWTTAGGRDKGIPPNWGKGEVTSKATSQAPVLCVVSGSGQNRLCFAANDALHVLKLKAGIVEEDGRLHCWVQLFTEAPVAIERYELVLRVDRRPVRYERALGDVSRWWAAQPGYTPSPVPPVAREPMYSTWYNFHQALDVDAVVEECRRAKELGCEAVIVDDGWQTLDSGRGYAFCGDWEPERIRDMRGFVDRIHALGMKFILWYSVPWIGKQSRAFQRFADKMLYVHEGLGAGVLDPRYPETRDYLIGIYEGAMREWGLDGFKLDFVDRYLMAESTPRGLGNGRDLASLEEGVDRLMGDVMRRLRALAPDVAIEFRQNYIGPLMRKYGNMFRAADCPADQVRNRYATVDVRLLCGETACHADMLMWHPSEPEESAALQLLAVLFSVPQISVRLDGFPRAHVEMLQFWLGFWKAHRDALLDGKLTAHSPELNYPLIEASTGQKRIAAAYADRVISLEDAPQALYLVNATRGGKLALELARPLGSRTVRVQDCRGRVVSEGRRELSGGIHRLEVPPAGLVSVL